MREQLVAAAEVQLEQVGPALSVSTDRLAPLADVISRRAARLTLSLAFAFTATAAIFTTAGAAIVRSVHGV